MNGSRKVGALVVVLWLAGWGAAVGLAQPTGFEGHQVVRVQVAEADLQTVQELLAAVDDVELWSEVLRPGTIDLHVSPSGLRLLELSGFEYETVIADLQAYINQQYAGPPDAGFFDQLRTFDEHVQFMQDLVATYPDLVELVEVGKTVLNRSMWGIRIAGPGEVKVGILYHGAIHGNEQAAASVVMYVANHLLENYDNDPAIKALVDHIEWTIVPTANPDGYVRNRRYNEHNVDLNRNFDGPGSGQDPSGGPYPFSEPETQAVRDYLTARPYIQVYMDLHGYVPWIMWPWGHIPDHCAHHDIFKGVGYEMRDRVAAAGGGTYTAGTIYEVAYPVSGCSTNFGYGVLEIWAYGIEVRNSTMPKICNDFLNALLYLGEWIAGYDCNGNGVPDPQDIQNQTSRDLNGNMVPDECEQLGDVNCDYYVDFGDINPFVLALTDPVGYAQQYPDCPLLKRDINGDGKLDFADINPFVTAVTQP